jgi:colicin import membrane protein
MLTSSISRRIPFIIAVALHVLLIAFLMVKLPNKHYRFHQASAPKKQKLVKAAVIDQGQVEAQITHIKHEEALKKQAELDRVVRLQHQAHLAASARRKEQKRLLAMRAEQSRLEQQRRAKKRAIAKLVVQQKKAAQLAKEKAVKARAHLKKIKQHELLVKQQELQKKLLAQQLSAEKEQLDKVHAQEMKGVLDKYRARILQAIRTNWHPRMQNSKVFSQLLVHLAPGGVVTSVDLLKGSGNAILDRSAKLAVYKSSPLPVPNDPSMFSQFRRFRIKMSPQDVLGAKNKAS